MADIGDEIGVRAFGAVLPRAVGQHDDGVAAISQRRFKGTTVARNSRAIGAAIDRSAALVSPCSISLFHGGAQLGMAQHRGQIAAEDRFRRRIAPADRAVLAQHDQRVRQTLDDRGVGAALLLDQGRARGEVARQPGDLQRQRFHQNGPEAFVVVRGRGELPDGRAGDAVARRGAGQSRRMGGRRSSASMPADRLAQQIQIARPQQQEHDSGQHRGDDRAERRPGCDPPGGRHRDDGRDRRGGEATGDGDERHDPTPRTPSGRRQWQPFDSGAQRLGQRRAA